MANQHSIVLSPEQADKLEALMEELPGFAPASRPYASYCYEKPGISVAYFPKKRKLLLQGSACDDFVEFTLDPKILGFSSMKLADKSSEKSSSKRTSTRASGSNELDERPHFGIDESGKGDYFGPLVIAGVYSSDESARALLRMGCTDSKAIKNEATINKLARQIMDCPGVRYEVVCIGPKRYNELYDEIKNLNHLLAWGHARVIASLHEQVPSCPRALSDQFANEWVLKSALAKRKVPVELEQRTRGESDIAVAAASILARERFVRWMREASVASGMKIPLGCAPHVLKAAKDFVATHGRERLPDVAKLHFKLTKLL